MSVCEYRQWTTPDTPVSSQDGSVPEHGLRASDSREPISLSVARGTRHVASFRLDHSLPASLGRSSRPAGRIRSSNCDQSSLIAPKGHECNPSQCPWRSSQWMPQFRLGHSRAPPALPQNPSSSAPTVRPLTPRCTADIPRPPDLRIRHHDHDTAQRRHVPDGVIIHRHAEIPRITRELKTPKTPALIKNPPLLTLAGHPNLRPLMPLPHREKAMQGGTTV